MICYAKSYLHARAAMARVGGCLEALTDDERELLAQGACSCAVCKATAGNIAAQVGLGQYVITPAIARGLAEYALPRPGGPR